MKLFLILAGVAFAGLLAIVAGAWYWWDKHSAEWLEAAQVAMDEGQNTGSRVEEPACVALALERYKSGGSRGITAAVRDGLWLTGCLDASKPQPKFCDDVPSEDNPISVGVWSASACAKHGASDPNCHSIFQTVSKYCSSPGRANKIKASAPPGPAT